MDIGKIELPNQPWKCPNCRTIWAPHVDFCKNCVKTDSGSDKKFLVETITNRKVVETPRYTVFHGQDCPCANCGLTSYYSASNNYPGI